MKFITSVIFSFFFIYGTLQFSTEIGPTEKVCYYELMEVGESLMMGYTVHDGPDFEIDFFLYDPSNNLLEQKIKASGNEISLDIKTKGKYEMCFINHSSQLPAKMISFYILTNSAEETKKKLSTDPLEKELSALKDGLRAVKEEQQYLVVRERIHRNTAESTNSRVLWWSLFESIILVGVCLWQVWYLKRFFEVKRSV